MRTISRPRTPSFITPLITDLVADCPITSRQVAWGGGFTAVTELVISVIDSSWVLPYAATCTGVYSGTAVSLTYAPRVWDYLRQSSPFESALALWRARPDRSRVLAGGSVCCRCEGPAVRLLVRADGTEQSWFCDSCIPGPTAPQRPSEAVSKPGRADTAGVS